MSKIRIKSHRREIGSDSQDGRWGGVFITLSVLLFVAFLMGGGARSDIASLMFLRPAAVLALGLGLMTLPLERVKAYRGLFAFAFTCIALVAAHLVPLPPSVWQSLPGRQIIAEIDQLAGLQNAWRPLSMDPLSTWNALWSLIVPAAVLVLAVQMSAGNHYRLLGVILLIGCVSSALALIQILGDAKGPAYLYRITNFGDAVGLFANRNHQAFFLACLVPLAMAWALQGISRKSSKSANGRGRLILVGLFMVFLVPLVVVTGSRSGLLVMLMSWGFAFWVYSAQKSRRKSSGNGKTWFSVGLIGIVFALLIFATYYFNRGVALERFFGSSVADDLRVPITEVTFDLSSQYAPWGSGVGSFKTIFRLHEPASFLAPQYVNHVHNDYLELLMTAGYPGIFLLAAAIFGAVWKARKLLFIKQLDDEDLERVRLARCGFSALALLFVASIGDYPLRIPSIQALAILATVWLFQTMSNRRADAKPV